MALIVGFTKVWEDADRVEYLMGTGSRIDERLVIEKRSRRGAPANGILTPMFRAAYYRILELQEATGAWPTEGTAA